MLVASLTPGRTEHAFKERLAPPVAVIFLIREHRDTGRLVIVSVCTEIKRIQLHFYPRRRNNHTHRTRHLLSAFPFIKNSYFLNLCTTYDFYTIKSFLPLRRNLSRACLNNIPPSRLMELHIATVKREWETKRNVSFLHPSGSAHLYSSSICYNIYLGTSVG